MENELIHPDYTFNYKDKFVSDTFYAIKNGEVCYVYNDYNLEQLKQMLDNAKIEYIIKENEDYWQIYKLGGKKRNER